MKIIFFIFFIIISHFANAEFLNVKWAKSTGGSAEDFSQSVVADLSGNVYITGYFLSSSITFGSINLINSNVGNQHIYTVKYDSNGNVLWAKSTGNNDIGYTRCVTTDVFGNLLVSGIFNSSSISFGSYILNNPAIYGTMFLVKYDYKGNALWAKNAINSSSSNGITSVSTDKVGNIYALGYFQDNSLDFGTETLINNGAPNQDIFLVKYDSSGNVLWAKNMGGADHDVGNSVNIDVNGNVFITGYFSSSLISFGSTTLNNHNSGNADIFIAKYDPSGNLIWAKSAGGNDTDTPNSIQTDQFGNAYIGGYFKSSSISFGTTILANPNSGYIKNFITKYDTNGNVLWAKSGSNTTKNDAINSLTTDKSGNIYSTGYFESPSITFDTIKLTNKSSSSQDLFVTKQDPSGNILWAKGFGGTANDYAKSISTDINGNAYLTGQFSSPSLAFDSEVLTNSSGSNDIFVAKLVTSKSDSLIINYCALDSIVTLPATDGYTTYSWINSKGIVVGSTKDIVVKNPVDHTIYTCNMTSVNNPAGFLYVTIIKSDPKADFSYQNNCKSNSIQFTNLSTKINGSLLYNWDFGNGNTSSQVNPLFTFSTSGLHKVSLTVSNPPSTCSVSVDKTVETFLSSLVRIDGDSTYCPGNSTTLKGHGAFHYKWSNGEKSDSIKINTPGRIWMLGYSSFGCVSDTIFKTISKEPDLTINIEGNTLICNDESTKLTATGGVSYRWNTGETTDTITVSKAESYEVFGMNKLGCEYSRKIQVVKDYIPQSDFSISKTTVDNRNNEITCSIPALNDAQYMWNMGDDSFENGPSIQHKYNVSNLVQEYKITLTVTTRNGCVYTKVKSIDVIPFIPNVFTPNGDHVNDLFMDGYDIQILDRNGAVLYTGNKGWDGTYNGKQLDPDTYFYMVYYTNKNHLKLSKQGYITLIR